jgi:type IV pilus assembly protein PilC
MQNYSYSARDDFGKLVRGTISAEDETDLANKVSTLGYYLVNFKAISSEAAAPKPKASDSLKAKDTLNLTIELATLLNAGMPLVAGLRDLAKDAERQNIQKVVDDIRFRVESGSSFKEALSYHPRSFSKLYIAIVGAGESTGKLPAALSDMASMLEWQAELKGKIKEAATYPIILFCVMVGVVSLLVLKIIPIFEPMFAEAKTTLPLPTRIVLGISNFARHYWLVMVILMIGAAFAYKFYNATKKGKYNLDIIKLKLPLAGPLLRKIALSQFCHTFALGLKSGVNVLTSLDIASEVIGNSRLEYSVVKARDAVNVGEKVSTSLQMSGEFPPLVVRMIGVGEQSGSLIQTLEKVNEFYDREVAATIKAMFAMFEPLMIVVMGAIVGGIALAIFLPIFQLSDLVGKK